MLPRQKTATENVNHKQDQKKIDLIEKSDNMFNVCCKLFELKLKKQCFSLFGLAQCNDVVC